MVIQKSIVQWPVHICVKFQLKKRLKRLSYSYRNCVLWNGTDGNKLHLRKLMAPSSPGTRLHLPCTNVTVKGPLSPSCGEAAKTGHTMPKAFATESVANWELNIEILLFAA